MIVISITCFSIKLYNAVFMITHLRE